MPIGKIVLPDSYQNAQVTFIRVGIGASVRPSSVLIGVWSGSEFDYIRAEAYGIVTSVCVDYGDKLTPGQTIITMELNPSGTDHDCPNCGSIVQIYNGWLVDSEKCYRHELKSTCPNCSSRLFRHRYMDDHWSIVIPPKPEPDDHPWEYLNKEANERAKKSQNEATELARHLQLRVLSDKLMRLYFHKVIDASEAAHKLLDEVVFEIAIFSDCRQIQWLISIIPKLPPSISEVIKAYANTPDNQAFIRGSTTDCGPIDAYSVVDYEKSRITVFRRDTTSYEIDCAAPWPQLVFALRAYCNNGSIFPKISMGDVDQQIGPHPS